MALKTPWPICSTCQAIPITIFRDEVKTEPFRLWTSFSAFADSVSRGCHTCTLLYEAVREPFKQRLDTEPVYIERALINSDEPQAVALTIDLASVQSRDNFDESLWKLDGQRSRFQYVTISEVKYVSDVKDVPQSSRHSKGLISLYTEDDGAFRFITQSLAKCLADHDLTCNRVIFPLSATASQLDTTTNIVHGTYGLTVAPTRLIDVGSEEPKSPPRLVNGQDCLKYGYLVLSYCWGMTPKVTPWKLTTATVQQFSEAIPLGVLPQTLHDAIIWTRKLGQRYIWIDSMCILQDSTEDWQREASRMASIYGSATLTLVGASSSIYGGMTDRRNPLRNHVAGLDLQDGSSRCTIYILPNGQSQSVTPPSPTDRRGWCYQEDLLSSRLVKLTQKTISWQCVGDGSNPATRAQGLEQLGRHPPYRWYTLWYRLIERYSNKSLTYPKDKLLAFYGIACDKIGSAYVAGLLKSDPWASLLWCRDENQIQQRPGRRYDEYVAPTWSWASIDAPVLFPEADARRWRKTQLEPSSKDPNFHQADAEPASCFDTGAITGGTIELSAYVAISRTASMQPFLFNTREGSHTYGRRNCVDPITGEALGMMVFDIATEAQDSMTLYCIYLQTADASLQENIGTFGFGLVVRVHEELAECLKGTRVGYIQLTSAFGRSCHKRRFVLS